VVSLTSSDCDCSPLGHVYRATRIARRGDGATVRPRRVRSAPPGRARARDRARRRHRQHGRDRAAGTAKRRSWESGGVRSISQFGAREWLRGSATSVICRHSAPESPLRHAARKFKSGIRSQRDLGIVSAHILASAAATACERRRDCVPPRSSVPSGNRAGTDRRATSGLPHGAAGGTDARAGETAVADHGPAARGR